MATNISDKIGKVLLNEEISVSLSRIKSIYEGIRKSKHDDWERTNARDIDIRETLYTQIKALDAMYNTLINELKKETKEREPKKPEQESEDFDHA